MKTTSLKTVYLTEDELKIAIAEFVDKRGKTKISDHLLNNDCYMMWAEDNSYFVINIDGEIDDPDSKEEIIVNSVNSISNDHFTTLQRLSTNIDSFVTCDVCGDSVLSQTVHNIKTDDLAGVTICTVCLKIEQSHDQRTKPPIKESSV